MRFPKSLFPLAIGAAFELATAALAFPHHDTPLTSSSHHAKRQTFLTNSGDLDGKSFDYVIVGGGQAGLTVAGRLAAQSNLTVAVIEAGTDGAAYSESLLIPGFAYLNGTGQTPLDWAYMTVNQTNAPGPSLARSWPRGKVLGGSSGVNGLFIGRPSEDEYDDGWKGLNPHGSEEWGWDEMQSAFKKAETYTPPSDQQESQFNITYDKESHGSSGPIQMSYSAFIYPDVSRWVPAMEELGVPSNELSAGKGRGSGLSTSCIVPDNQTRSYSKTGYIDPFDLPNLSILTSHRVTKVLFSSESNSNVTATGVEFAEEPTGTASASASRFTVQANKEVILSGGSINTPQILQLSGVGQGSLLSGLGIETVIDLPGVGQNLQDHMSSNVFYQSTSMNNTWNNLASDEDLKSDQLQIYQTDPKNSQWSYVNEAVAYISGEDLFGSNLSDFTNSLDIDSIVSVNKDHNPGVDDTVVTGWKAQHQVSKKYLGGDVGWFEIIFSMLGGGPGVVEVQMSSMHPFARGSVLINSSDPFAVPLINPNYVDNEQDLASFRAALTFVRRLPETQAWSGWVTSENAPGPNITADADVDTYIGKSGATSYHPIGTASMLPKEQGGVVDTTLLVYGTSNLRVIDASIMPLHISAHTMGPTYSVAEKGASIVLAKANGHGSSDSSGSDSGTSGDSNDNSSSGCGSSMSVRSFRTLSVIFSVFYLFNLF